MLPGRGGTQCHCLLELSSYSGCTPKGHHAAAYARRPYHQTYRHGPRSRLPQEPGCLGFGSRHPAHEMGRPFDVDLQIPVNTERLNPSDLRQIHKRIHSMWRTFMKFAIMVSRPPPLTPKDQDRVRKVNPLPITSRKLIN